MYFFNKSAPGFLAACTFVSRLTPRTFGPFAPQCALHFLKLSGDLKMFMLIVEEIFREQLFPFFFARALFIPLESDCLSWLLLHFGVLGRVFCLLDKLCNE